MSEKLEGLVGEYEYHLQALYDIFDNSNVVDEFLIDNGYNPETHFIKVTVEIIPK